MSIMSDKWIRRQCEAPQGYMDLPGYGKMEMVKNQHGDWISREWGLPSSNYGGFPVITYPEGTRPINYDGPMIEPFAPQQIKMRGGALRSPTPEEEAHDEATDPMRFEMKSYRTPLEKIISYGTSSYGYDLRCSNKFKIFTNINSTVVDPKNFDEKAFVNFEGDVCIIPPNSFALASSVEYFRIPRNILTVCLGKSTYARCGIIVNVTPFEPEWEGHVTLEFSNTTPLPAKIYANEGVAQVLFLRGDETPDVSYKDRGGKYMNQTAEPIPPRT